MTRLESKVKEVIVCLGLGDSMRLSREDEGGASRRACFRLVRVTTHKIRTDRFIPLSSPHLDFDEVLLSLEIGTQTSAF